MKIFGINFTTKKELKEQVADLLCDVEVLSDELDCMIEDFPFVMGEVVYDVALKNAKGRYTKTKPSLSHSTITEVVVDEKNYFNLVKRLQRKDVFFEYDEAKEYLESICK
jgi:hypothetical protein